MEKRPERDDAGQILSTRDFFRSLSYREFVTSLSLALLILAINSVLGYYADENWFGGNEFVVKVVMFCLVVPLNHVFYKIEHKRSNTFIGRNVHDYIFILIFASLYQLILFIYGFGFQLDIGNPGIFILGFVIVVALFELALALVKRCLKFVRWQVF